MRQTKFLSLLSISLILLVNAGISFGRDIQLTDKDKAQIIKSILLRVDFLDRDWHVGENKEVVNLSTENISSELVPKIHGISFILFSPNEVEEKVKTGFGYYSFEEFKVKRSKVIVSFGHTWRNNRFGAYSHRNTEYEFHKIKGRWRGKTVGFNIRMS